MRETRTQRVVRKPIREQSLDELVEEQRRDARRVRIGKLDRLREHEGAVGAQEQHPRDEELSGKRRKLKPGQRKVPKEQQAEFDALNSRLVRVARSCESYLATVFGELAIDAAAAAKTLRAQALNELPLGKTPEALRRERARINNRLPSADDIAGQIELLARQKPLRGKPPLWEVWARERESGLRPGNQDPRVAGLLRRKARARYLVNWVLNNVAGPGGMQSVRRAERIEVRKPDSTMETVNRHEHERDWFRSAAGKLIDAMDSEEAGQAVRSSAFRRRSS